ncbi:MAG: YncE family protein, partial [Thermoplasmata archaeon]|nr:YncE family protein [Thermoplasmata archaeon]
NVSVLNASTNRVIASIAVGGRPTAVVDDPQNGWLYVVYRLSHAVTVINESTDTVIGTLHLHGYDRTLSEYFDPTNGHIYVGFYDPYSGYGIADFFGRNATLNTTFLLPSYLEATLLSGAGNDLLLDGGYSSSLVQFDPATGKLGSQVPTGEYPNGIAYDARDGQIFVTEGQSDAVTVVNATTFKVATIVRLAYYPFGAAYDPANGELLFTDQSHLSNHLANGDLLAINGSTGLVVGTVGVGSEPTAITYDPANRDVYVADFGGGNVTVLNGTTLNSVASISIGTTLYPTNPNSIAYDAANQLLYVSSAQTTTVSVVNGSTQSVVGSIPLRTQRYGLVSATGVAYDGTNQRIYAVVSSGRGVLIINTSKGAVVNHLAIDAAPSMAFDPASGHLFVVSGGVLDILARNNSVVGTVQFPVGDYSASTESVAFDPMDGLVYVVCENGMAVVDPTNDSLVGFINLAGTTGTPWYEQAESVALDPANGELFAPIPAYGTIAVVSPSAATVAYPVTFTETGLASGKNWSVTLGGVTRSSTNATIRFIEPFSDQLAFSVTPIVRYRVAPGSGWIIGLGYTSSSIDQKVEFTFIPLRFPVTFRETGLPQGMDWTVKVGSNSTTANSTSLTFYVLNGSYYYRVGDVSGWHLGTGRYHGMLSVNGSAVVQNLSFFRVTYLLTIREAGLPAGANWSVTLKGTTVTTSTTNMTFLLPNGTYRFRISPIPGWYSSPDRAKGYAYVGGADTVLTETFAPTTYTIVIKESGLPAGTRWNVTIGGTTVSSTSTKIVFSLTNGTYAFSTASFGYTASPASGNLTVAGSAFSRGITFT